MGGTSIRTEILFSNSNNNFGGNIGNNFGLTKLSGIENRENFVVCELSFSNLKLYLV